MRHALTDAGSFDPTYGLCEIIKRAPGGGAGPGGPGPGTPPARAVSASKLKLVSKRRKLRVELTCVLTAQPAATARCGSKRVSLTAPRTISLAPKASRTLTLTKRGRSLVRRSKKLSVVVASSLRTVSGVKTSRQTLTLKR